MFQLIEFDFVGIQKWGFSFIAADCRLIVSLIDESDDKTHLFDETNLLNNSDLLRGLFL